MALSQNKRSFGSLFAIAQLFYLFRKREKITCGDDFQGDFPRSRTFNTFLECKNNSGIILLTVLWALVILTVLTIGLGRNTHIDLLLTKHAIGKVKAKYLAWAGLVYAVDKIRLDTADTESSKQDTLYYCAIPANEERPPQDLFQEKTFGEGSFHIRYQQKGLEGEDFRTYAGMMDEERKININALAVDNIKILSSLMGVLGFDEQTAKTVAYSILDWKDQDDVPSDLAYGAENEYYGGLTRPYRCKNRPFDSLSELRLVKGVTPGISKALSNYITVFPKKGKLLVNLDTASGIVLKSIARAYSGPGTNTEESDADSLSEKILNYRRGEDQQEFTEDDRLIESRQIDFNAKEKVLFSVMSRYRTKKSNYVRVQVKGVEHNRHAEATIEAVIQRDGLSIVYWHRN